MTFFSSVLRKILAVVAVVGLCVGTLEILTRIFDPNGISYYPETAAYLDTMIIEAPIGYRNRPNLEGFFYKVPVKINSLGLRDEEISLTPKKDEYRILVMGDSVPFGVGVPFEHTIPYILEQKMNHNLADLTKRKFRTINMGVPSYNTEQEWMQLNSLGAQLNPDCVVLIFVANDFESKMWVYEKRSKWYIDLAQRSYAASFLFFAAKHIWAGVDQSTLSFSGLIPDASNPLATQAVEGYLSKMNELCRSKNIPFIVFTLASDATGKNLVQQVGRRESFPVRDLIFWRQERWQTDDPKQYFVPHGGSHFNRAGNDICATILFETIREQVFFDARKAIPNDVP